jgi:hypothetical protein
LLAYNKKEEEFYKFLEKEIEPISFGELKETAYRASVYLLDNTYIPCVLFRNSYAQTDRAIRTFDETRNKIPADPRIGYRQHVRAFTTGDNIIASDIISRIEKSPFAISTACYLELSAMMELEGGGISFLGKMKDGQKFNYFIDSDVEFIEMPNGYVASQLIEIIPHTRRDDFKDLKEKFFFNCCLDYIPYP